jgi:hypothetical protein
VRGHGSAAHAAAYHGRKIFIRFGAFELAAPKVDAGKQLAIVSMTRCTVLAIKQRARFDIRRAVTMLLGRGETGEEQQKNKPHWG